MVKGTGKLVETPAIYQKRFISNPKLYVQSLSDPHAKSPLNKVSQAKSYAA